MVLDISNVEDIPVGKQERKSPYPTPHVDNTKYSISWSESHLFGSLGCEWKCTIGKAVYNDRSRIDMKYDRGLQPGRKRNNLSEVSLATVPTVLGRIVSGDNFSTKLIGAMSELHKPKRTNRDGTSTAAPVNFLSGRGW